mgnify:FL=1
MSRYCLVITDAVSFNSLYRGQLEYLSSQGFRLTLICGGSQDEVKKLENRQVGKVIHIGMARNPSPVSDLLCLIRLWWHFLFNRYDLVVATTPKAILLGSLASFFSMQKKRIAFFRGRVYENYTGLKRKIFTFLDYLAVRLTHQSLFVSPSLKNEYIKDIRLVARKGFVVGGGSGNGIDTVRFAPTEVAESTVNDLRNTLGIAEDEFVVISIGRICKDKGMLETEEIARALRNHTPKIRFLMLGRVEDPSFYSLFGNLLEDGTVQHIDSVEDIRSYVAASHLHLFLTHREGFGNVAIEAAAMNVPTLAYDVVGVRDSVAEGISGLKVPLKDTAAVIEKLSYFANNPSELKQKYSGARAWAEANYSQQQVWENYRGYYLDQIS